MLRKESANMDADGRPIYQTVEDSGGEKYIRGFHMLRYWIDHNLDVYKPELRRVLWPVFVYSLLELASEYFVRDCDRFYNEAHGLFSEGEHADEVKQLRTVRTPEHVQESHLAKLYRNNKYRITLTNMACATLLQFLESKEKDAGTVILGIITRHLNIVTVDRTTAGNERTLSTLLAGRGADFEAPPEDEGIPGHNPGSANTDKNAPPVLAKLNLGPMPMEPDMMEDVRADLQEQDAKNPPLPGQNSLVEEFEHRIKREPTEDTPSRDALPLPPSTACDVAMEVQRVKENRDRFKMEGKSGGVGPGVSVTMYTFHNTHDSVNCLDFSGDYKMVAAGMAESYVRVWSLDGKPLPQLPSESSQPTSSRRLVGHSGPVFAVSFSPSTENPNSSIDMNSDGPFTHPAYLLSCSADKTIRLWSMDAWACLVSYKGHNSPVWDVQWSPFGHYFLTGGYDRAARLWSTEQISALRIFVGHDLDVDHVCFHPNSIYAFTGSSDKTVRMWDVNRGNAVRMFTGHAGHVTALACAPNGLWLASADDAGSIVVWDLKEGRRRKLMRGHGKGGIWSLSWNVESTVLVSGGADGTVRVWDVAQQAPDSASGAAVNGKVIAEGGTGTKVDGSGAAVAGAAAGAGGAAGGAQAAAGAAAAGSSKKQKGGKDVVVTGDQISAFPTKKSPVYKVVFTQTNLVIAGGAYLP
ncbi:transcription initiation factor TFIID, subunit TAF5 [Lineolata rhizophorae]|uniref:Transcription initiation factor TFIID, subunit TAF5 n=1 Tax=Lineolata rhizophorae TaxID=578093 RepID=A0A6A6P649_9PEZI|nr:transcription initiation factor TFIID, subunit TAF5 [Lineolata rhizophorae]